MPISWHILDSSATAGVGSVMTSESHHTAAGTGNFTSSSSSFGTTSATNSDGMSSSEYRTILDSSSWFASGIQTASNGYTVTGRTNSPSASGNRYTSGQNSGITISSSLTYTTILSGHSASVTEYLSSLHYLFGEYGTLSASNASYENGVSQSHRNRSVHDSFVRSTRALLVSADESGRTTHYYTTSETGRTNSENRAWGNTEVFWGNHSESGWTHRTETNGGDSATQTVTTGQTESYTSFSVAANGVATFTTSTRTTSTTAYLTSTTTQTYSTSYSAASLTTTHSRLTTTFTSANATTTTFDTTTALHGASYAIATVWEATGAEVMFPLTGSTDGTQYLTNPSTRFTSTLRTTSEEAVQRASHTVSTAHFVNTPTSGTFPVATSFASGSLQIHTTTAQTLSWAHFTTSESTTTAWRERGTRTVWATFGTTRSSRGIFQSGTVTNTGVVYFTASGLTSFAQWISTDAGRTVGSSSSAFETTINHVSYGTSTSESGWTSFASISYTDYVIPSSWMTAANPLVRFASQRPSYYTTTSNNGETYQTSRMSLVTGIANAVALVGTLNQFGGLGAASQSLAAHAYAEGSLRSTRVSSGASESARSSYNEATANIAGIAFAIERPSVLLGVQDIRTTFYGDTFFSPRSFKDYNA